MAIGKKDFSVFLNAANAIVVTDRFAQVDGFDVFERLQV